MEETKKIFFREAERHRNGEPIHKSHYLENGIKQCGAPIFKTSLVETGVNGDEYQTENGLEAAVGVLL